MPTCDLAQQVFAALPVAATDGAPVKFLAVPGAGEPRWLLPESCRNVDSVLSNWSPYRFSSRLKWQAIRAANRIGAAQLLPNLTAIEVGNMAGIDWRRMAWNGSAPPVPIIYLGTPGMSRKAVIHLVERASGQCAAIVKVPLAEGAKPAILREADMLATLAEEKYLCAPRLRHVDRERGIATQTFISGTSGERRFSGRCGDLLRCLVLRDETTTIAEGAVVLQEPAAFESHPDLLSALLAELGDTRRLPACWVHGDFAPWNIKRRPGQEWMLIDWEDAQRGGLPLHDYYHFLHMQDYLFGQRPTVHFTAAEHLAATMGITATQCRKLEIAYLADSYLKCTAQQERAHTDFLLISIGIALQARSRPVAVAYQEVTGRPTVGRQPANRSRQLRAQLFAAMIAQFNSTGVRYCILSGCDDDPAGNTSDVDVMVHPGDIRRIPAVLTQSARSAGAQLIQAIHHEIAGCYFILAKQDGQQTGFLDPDCCSDYRRGGRLWLSANQVIAGRRRYQDFYVPAVPDEFLYYLIKKVLKQSITCHQLKRLQHLYARDPAECQRRLARFWPQSTALQLQRALVQQDLAWFQTRLKPLLVELKRSAPVERGFDRGVGKLRDLGRLRQRLVHPTGMSVLVIGSESGLRSEIADRLRQSLASAFRWTARATPVSTFPSALSLAARIFRARRRSTLIVGTAALETPAIGLRQGWRQLRSILTRPLLRPDLVLAVESQSRDRTQEPGRGAANNPAALNLRTRTIHLDANLSPEQIVAAGTSMVLGWLASRLERRPRVPGPSAHVAGSFDNVAEPVELRSAGSD